LRDDLENFWGSVLEQYNNQWGTTKVRRNIQARYRRLVPDAPSNRGKEKRGSKERGVREQCTDYVWYNTFEHEGEEEGDEEL
jgi:hypothetical protein